MYITLAEAADQLDCSIRHLRRLIADGQLRAVTIGSNRVIRIHRDDLSAMIRPVVPSGKR